MNRTLDFPKNLIKSHNTLIKDSNLYTDIRSILLYHWANRSLGRKGIEPSMTYVIEFTAQPVIPTNGTFLKPGEKLEFSFLMHEINVLTNWTILAKYLGRIPWIEQGTNCTTLSCSTNWTISTFMGNKTWTCKILITLS